MSRPYEALCPAGTKVRIAERSALEAFAKNWKLHNPLSLEQMPFAGRIATVKSVGYYHGGDVLYVLQDVPGVWHEACLAAEREQQ
jgi:hypothetical protein